MAFEYTRQIQDRLDRLASLPDFAPGLSLMGAIHELEAIRTRGAYPARFQLMQFIAAQPHVAETETGFSVTGPVSGEVYTFSKPADIEQPERMEPAERKRCAAWLAERAMSVNAGGERGEGYYRRVFTALVEKNSWMRYRESDQRYLYRVFDRHFAYEMGHCLGFTLEQMQAFLDRVLPDEVYINRDAEDLAQAYAFAHGKSAAVVARALSALQAAEKSVPQYAAVDGEGTRQLYEQAVGFEGTEAQFVEWLLERRMLLEGRSRTAMAVYVNLLICAYLMLRALYNGAGGTRDDPTSVLWVACFEDGEDMRAWYDANHARFGLPEFDRLDWKKAAAEFDSVSEWAPSEQRERRYPRDFLVYLSIDKDGSFTTENTFSRIPRIMNEGAPVQKRDVLCLLWLIYTFAWEYVAPEEISGQLHDFIDLATGVLEQCNFRFYLPNPLEYSICRSLIVGGDMEDAYRSIVNRGTESPLCEELCLRDGDTGDVCAVRFYTCERYSFDQLSNALYTLARGEDFHVYNDVWKDMELLLTKADQKLQCGWERISDAGQIARIEAQGRVVELPPRR